MANATKHYAYYPDEKDVPIYLAYGFRPIFLLLAPYIVISSILWGLVYSGYIPFLANDILTWHIYEFLYGIGIAGIMAFIFTGIPELYPGMVPFIGKRLKYIVALWALGRISFWFIDFISIYIVFILNISVLSWIIFWAFKPVVLDKLQRHSSIAYTITALLGVQIWFFISQIGFINTSSLDILKVALGLFMVLTLLALRRVNMEALNEIIEEKEIDDVFLARPYRYNLAIFTVLLFTVVEFFYPINSVLIWLGFAAACAILSILNDYVLKYESILGEPFVWYLGTIILFMSLGYFFMGYDILDESIYGMNHFRHFLSTGAFGLAFFIVMVIISTVHTGRVLKSNAFIVIGYFLIVISALIRGFIPFYEEYIIQAYIVSSIIWAIPFAIYIKKYYPYLLSKRADGIKG